MLQSYLPASAIVDTKPEKTDNEIIKIEIEENIFDEKLRKKLKKTFNKGPIKDIELIGGHIGYFLSTKKNGISSTHNKIDNNLPIIGFKGHLRDDTLFKFSYLPSYSVPRYERPKHRIFEYFLQKEFNDKHKLTLGQVRTPVGVEGSTSMFYLTTGRRSLMAKKFSNITSLGARIQSDYDWVETDLGVFSTGRLLKNNFEEPPEFAGQISFKPIKNPKYGKLKVGGGYNKGKLDYDYSVYSSHLFYEYKKIFTEFEYMFADGFNGYENSPAKAYGYYGTVGYNITPKLQFFNRLQKLDPNKNAINDNKNQYEIGFNYFVKGQKLRFTLSYVYTDNENTSDTNQIFLSTQIIL